MRRLRVLVLVHPELVPPDSIEGLSDEEVFKSPWKTEFDVAATLRESGHTVEVLGVVERPERIGEALERLRPHVVFNLLEEFHGVAGYDQHVVSYLELRRQPYTGSNPRGLVLSRDKALSKKILGYDGVPVPRFAVLPRGRRFQMPDDLAFPLFVKSVSEEGSLGISRASIVRSEAKLAERVEFIHEHVGTDAIAEAFVPGRDLYVGILGHRRLTTLPIWELVFTKAGADVPRIATDRVKWSLPYQKRMGVETRAATDVSSGLARRIRAACIQAYRSLGLSGYARMDLRLRPDGRFFFLEANPNPQLGYGEDFAESAEAGGLPYDALLQRILRLGISYRAEWKR